jgi:hypothetical protein
MMSVQNYWIKDVDYIVKVAESKPNKWGKSEQCKM